MSQTPTPSPAARLRDIYLKSASLPEAEVATERDYWKALDLLQQERDAIRDMAENLELVSSGVLVRIGDTNIRFESVGDMANWIIKEWETSNGQR